MYSYSHRIVPFMFSHAYLKSIDSDLMFFGKIGFLHL